MSVSLHSAEFDELKAAFIETLTFWMDKHDAPEAAEELFSIMNDYGAVSWT